ncbi:hypothetical protein LB467_10820 [Salegentibacter sp. JZCK2]|uniref:nitrilase-related carbon-nitrogen hydrolase n=1 Tax=Salegentibacter tibetensis TaxID=2873600 RepID=UPI001CCC372E|nr:nitrilase-related carbon-nitrogen hydrolase [Salegentibacter tibetensis]MBZ9730179.1 hypothetical protein [Salegentibacter tibetensis]
MKSAALKVSLAQILPVWLCKKQTIEKIKDHVNQAGNIGCNLIVFGEGLLPGYPFWLALANGAEFNLKIHKEIHAHYIRNSIGLEAGELVVQGAIPDLM